MTMTRLPMPDDQYGPRVAPVAYLMVTAEGDNRLIREILEDLYAREDLGMEVYGVPLTTRNGRDSLMDLYEELMDAFFYAVQYDMERFPKAGTASIGTNRKFNGLASRVFDVLKLVAAILDERRTPTGYSVEKLENVDDDGRD